jgi:hypothetical protein
MTVGEDDGVVSDRCSGSSVQGISDVVFEALSSDLSSSGTIVADGAREPFLGDNFALLISEHESARRLDFPVDVWT